MLEDADHELVGQAVKAVSTDPGVDAVIALMKPVAVIDIAETAGTIVSSVAEDKPVLAAFLGGDAVRPGRRWRSS